MEDYEFVSHTDGVNENIGLDVDVQSKLENVKAKIQIKVAKQKFSDGNDQFSLKNFDSAEKLYTEAISLWPDNIRFYGNRCTSLIRLGEYKRALQDAQHILAVDHNSAMGHECLARSYLICGDYGDAEQAIAKLLPNADHKKSYDKLTDLCTKLRESKKKALHSYGDKVYRIAWYF